MCTVDVVRGFEGMCSYIESLCVHVCACRVDTVRGREGPGVHAWMDVGMLLRRVIMYQAGTVWPNLLSSIEHTECRYCG